MPTASHAWRKQPSHFKKNVEDVCFTVYVQFRVLRSGSLDVTCFLWLCMLVMCFSHNIVEYLASNFEGIVKADKSTNFFSEGFLKHLDHFKKGCLAPLLLVTACSKKSDYSNRAVNLCCKYLL